MSEWIWLSVQAALTLIAVEQLRRRVLVNVEKVQLPELLLDVWIPLAITLPLYFMAGRIGSTVHGVGWMVIGAPAVYGMFAVSAAMIVSARFPHVQHGLAQATTARLTLAWVSAGLILLLLAAAHDLTLWMGQCAFAVGAVLLWMNTPEQDDERPTEYATASQVQAGMGMTIALFCCAGQGMIALHIPDHAVAISATLIVAGAAMTIACAACIAGPPAALRVGGWAATYGLFLGLGSISLVNLAPQVWTLSGQFLASESLEVSALNRLAFGFGAYVPESILLMAMGGLAIAQHYTDMKRYRIFGWLLLIAAAVLAGWRINAMSPSS